MKTVPLKLTAVLVPYTAVLIGLYIFKNAWLAIGLYHVGMIVFLIAGDRKRLLKMVFTGWNPAAALIGTALSVMILPILLFFWKHMQLENTSFNTALADLGLHGVSWVFFMIYFSTVQPLLEELYWRGYLTQNCSCFSWTDFAFAGYHLLVLAWFIKLPWLVVAFLLLTLTASVWRFMTFKYEGLMVPLVSHMAADISIITATSILIH